MNKNNEIAEIIGLLKSKNLFLFDMDGTLCLDDILLDGVCELIGYIRAYGQPVFLTNNSSRGVDSYIDKMNRLGIETTQEDFLTSVDATIYYLRNTYSDAEKKHIYIAGTESFKSQMRAEGFEIIDEGIYDNREIKPEEIDIVIIGFDRELNYRKIENLSEILSLNPNCGYIATNPDKVCPTVFGYVPDCGSIAEMINCAVNRMPRFIGKPEPLMAELAMKRFGYSEEETMIIGDRLYTDIACGKNAGIDTCFVLSGEGLEEDIEKYGIYPTLTLSGVGEILKLLKSRGEII